MKQILSILWKFIIKQICFVDKKEFDIIQKRKSLINKENETRIENLHNYIDSESANKNNNEILYCIVPYFNYLKSINRRQLFIDFLNKYKDIENLNIIIIEGVFTDEVSDLPTNISGIYKYLSITINDVMWIKENLINIAIKYLPSDWEYVAWIDADIQFLNNNWITDTINKLKQSNILQLFQHAINLGPTGETFKLDDGFIYSYKTHISDYNNNCLDYYLESYTTWHPGYAWAMNRDFYNKSLDYNILPIIDYCIIGSNDHHMATAFIYKSSSSYPEQICQEYKDKIIKYENFCRSINVSFDYINGTIVHYWHGSLKNRKYNDRWNILIDNNYNPSTDIYCNDKGLFKFTKKGEKFNKIIIKYFYERKEDSNNI
jgi:hypothetical protein